MSSASARVASTIDWLRSNLIGSAEGWLSPTGPLAFLVVGTLFLAGCAVLVVALPICYAAAPLDELATTSAYPEAARKVAQVLTGPHTDVLRIDHSVGSVICIVLFLGVVLQLIVHCRMIDRLTNSLGELADHPNTLCRYAADRHLAPLLEGIHLGPGSADRSERILRFYRNLAQHMRIRQYEGYLVAIGLIGTLLAFYIGFAERLAPGMTYASLDSTARELLTVVGTAAISSVSGLVLGMLAVPFMADYLTTRRKALIDQAGTTLDAVMPLNVPGKPAKGTSK